MCYLHGNELGAMRQLSPAGEGFGKRKEKSWASGPGRGGGTQPHSEMGQPQKRAELDVVMAETDMVTAEPERASQ